MAPHFGLHKPKSKTYAVQNMYFVVCSNRVCSEGKVSAVVWEAEYLWTTVAYVLWPTGASALLGSLPGALAAGTMCRLIPKHRPLICLYHPKRSDHKIFRETCRDCQWLILTSDHNTVNSSEITSWLLYHSDMLCVAHETRSCAAVSSHVV